MSSSASGSPFDSPLPPQAQLAPPPPPPPPELPVHVDERDKEYHTDSVVTYRHLLSPQTLTPTNPLRVIAHCDVDSAYAQFERVRLGLDPSVPICVQQWQNLLAVSYPARKFGIKRMTTPESARLLCPEVVIVHVPSIKTGELEPVNHPNPSVKTYKISLDPYRRQSERIVKVFQREVPEGIVEKASIDEAFIDLTVPVRSILLARYPYLAQVPSDSPLGLDTPLPPPPALDWESTGWGTPPALPGSVDGWADVALYLGAELMDSVRRAVQKELGYTTSAGLSHSKILAKVGSGYKKPNAQTVLRTSAVSRFLRPLPFQKIRNLGGKLGRVLADTYEAFFVEDLLAISLDQMQATFGEESLWIYNLLRGVDHRAVKELDVAKSMTASKDILGNLLDINQADPWLRLMCAELVGRLKDARGETIKQRGDGVWPRTLVLNWRNVHTHTGDSRYAHQTKQAGFPFHEPLTADGPIYTIAKRLLAEVFAAKVVVSSIGLCFTNIERAEEGQRKIEGFFTGLGVGVGGKRGKTTENAVAGSSTSREDTARPFTSVPDGEELSVEDKEEKSWTCPDCRRVLAVPSSDFANDDPDFELNRVQAEHQDWHVARALQDETVGTGSSSSSSTKRDGTGKTKGPASKRKKTSNGKEEGTLGGWLVRK